MNRNDSSLVGSKVFLKTNDGEYEGVVRTIIGELSKVSLFNVKVLPERQSLIGLQTFFGREIKQFKVLEAKHKIKKEKASNDRKVTLAPLPFGLVETAEGEEMAEVNKPKYRKLVYKKGKLWLVMGDLVESSTCLDLDLDKPLINFELPDRYEIISAINDNFMNAVDIIGKESVIGVHLEGANMGREGEICLLNISTKICIYLFDIFELGDSAFASGLKKILENENITKVFHDCRLHSDILFHHHKVTLKNVSDTQVIDIMQRRYYSRKLQVPEFVRSMFSLCKEFLKLDEESISFNQDHNNRVLNDVMSWQVRPLPQNHRIIAISHVIYLVELQKALMERFLRDINKGTEIFLRLIRDTNNNQFAKEITNRVAVPSAIGNLFGQQFNFNHNYMKPRDPENGLCIFDKVDILKTVMTGNEAVDFCMKELKISDFKEEDSDLSGEEASNVKLLNDFKAKKIPQRLESKSKMSENVKSLPTESYGMVRPSEESSDISTGSISDSDFTRSPVTPAVQANRHQKKYNFIPAGYVEY